ncbi:MAG: hypothetical protein IT210_05585 [Armatimonadetes bacterium]|nr:hypothetical protein [Armatimonadota bacterium]
MGFYDLEMCRVECEARQEAFCLGMFAKNPEGWDPYRAGWEAADPVCYRREMDGIGGLLGI